MCLVVQDIIRRSLAIVALTLLLLGTNRKRLSLSRKSFRAKKQGTDSIPGFSQGSFSELEIAQCPDWTPSTILQRGMKMLRFIEDHWDVRLGSDEDKKALLNLRFL
jgi:hypothetical protein